MITPPICVDVKTAAEMIGLSPSVIRSFIDAGSLPIVKFPSQKHEGETSRRVLIAIADLEAFVAKHRTVEVGR